MTDSDVDVDLNVTSSHTWRGRDVCNFVSVSIVAQHDIDGKYKYNYTSRL